MTTKNQALISNISNLTSSLQIEQTKLEECNKTKSSELQKQREQNQLLEHTILGLQSQLEDLQKPQSITIESPQNIQNNKLTGETLDQIMNNSPQTIQLKTLKPIQELFVMILDHFSEFLNEAIISQMKSVINNIQCGFDNEECSQTTQSLRQRIVEYAQVPEDKTLSILPTLENLYALAQASPPPASSSPPKITPDQIQSVLT